MSTPWYMSTIAIMILFIWLNVSGMWEQLLHQDTIILGKDLCLTEKDFYYSNFNWCEKYGSRYNTTNTEVRP